MDDFGCYYLHREYFFLIALLRFGLIVSEHKDIAARGVSMEVTEEKDVTAL